MDEKTEKQEYNTLPSRALIHNAYDAPCANATRERDYINKYEHIGLREGMYVAREKRNHTFIVDQGKSQCIIVNIAPFIIRKVRANFNRANKISAIKSNFPEVSRKCITCVFFRFIQRIQFKHLKHAISFRARLTFH